MKLIPGRGYILSGMAPEMWTGPHLLYGTPDTVAGKYLGCLNGSRRWHGFEVWVNGAEQGVIFGTDQDLAKLTVQAISDPL